MERWSVMTGISEKILINSNRDVRGQTPIDYEYSESCNINEYLWILKRKVTNACCVVAGITLYTVASCTLILRSSMTLTKYVIYRRPSFKAATMCVLLLKQHGNCTRSVIWVLTGRNGIIILAQRTNFLHTVSQKGSNTWKLQWISILFLNTSLAVFHHIKVPSSLFLTAREAAWYISLDVVPVSSLSHIWYISTVYGKSSYM